jgi:RNA polymerase sigma-70 factor (ECF subfamily)
MEELARAARDGDREAFRKLVDLLGRPLIAAAYRYTGDWEGARDLAQETWLRVWRHLPTYEPARSFRVWVFAIHRNVCLSDLRRRSRHPEDAASDDDLARLGPSVEPADLDDTAFADRLRRALPALSPAQRDVFVRVDLEQGDQGEVARDLGMQPTTLRTTLHFARQRLARRLVADQE